MRTPEGPAEVEPVIDLRSHKKPEAPFEQHSLLSDTSPLPVLVFVMRILHAIVRPDAHQNAVGSRHD